MWCLLENLNMPSSKTIFSVAASFTASAVILRTIVDDFVPDSVTAYFTSGFRNISTKLSSQVTVIIEESNGLTPNQMFDAANIYLGTELSTSAPRIKAHKPEKEEQMDISIDKDQELLDSFQGLKLKWVLGSSRVEKSGSNKKRNGSSVSVSEIRHFEVSFHKKHKDVVLRTYLPYILQRAKAIREENKTVKLHTIDYNGTDYWGCINFDHPATFDTIAMDPDKKQALIEDLDLFVARKEFYRRVGKAWKRGYLFYGPPGTGKSSLVAAMANYLKFDVYDLDLKEIQCNSDLRRLLIGAASRSIVVIEDIDRSLESVEDDKMGLLNFIDGLWSSSGDERLIVFTTNNKDQLDPVLLRPGRMDMHIHMSYCTPSGFGTLAYNYLQIREHPLLAPLEELLDKVQATPAEVAGELMKSTNVELALQGLVEFLERKASSAAQ